MTRPQKIPEIQLKRIQGLENKLERMAKVGNLKKAKVILDDLKPILEKYNHNARVLQAYLKLYEAALESNSIVVAKRGFQFVRNEANKRTRLYLEATTLLAIAHLRSHDLFSAEPLMAEALKNDVVITSKNKRRQFRKEIIDRFDQEGALAAMAKIHPEFLSEAEIHSEALKLLRNGMNEEDIAENIGANVPLQVKNFILKVDQLSKNLLPHEERLLLPSPADYIDNKNTGKIIFGGLKRRLYNAVCENESKTYQSWLKGGLNAIVSENYVAGAVLVALANQKIAISAVAVGITAMLIKVGIGNFCDRNRPISLMSLRKK